MLHKWPLTTQFHRRPAFRGLSLWLKTIFSLSMIIPGFFFYYGSQALGNSWITVCFAPKVNPHRGTFKVFARLDVFHRVGAVILRQRQKRFWNMLLWSHAQLFIIDSIALVHRRLQTVASGSKHAYYRMLPSRFHCFTVLVWCLISMLKKVKRMLMLSQFMLMSFLMQTWMCAILSRHYKRVHCST